jgi:hypothetical protein
MGEKHCSASEFEGKRLFNTTENIRRLIQNNDSLD